MKLATLQFDSKIGDTKHNIDCADSLLEASNLEDVQLLVGPELAFTGYNFPSLQAISEFLEPTCAGITAQWAARIAQRYELVVSIGYPEITTDPSAIPKTIAFDTSIDLESLSQQTGDYVASIRHSSESEPKYWTFNSTLTVGPNGEVLAHYRKTHLYYTDVTWASPSITGFSSASILYPGNSMSPVDTSFAICMDLNPKAFTAEWRDYEVANYVLTHKSSLLVVSTAWMGTGNPVETSGPSPCCPENTYEQPDLDTLTYWIERLSPLIVGETVTTVVVANRVGNEVGPLKAYDLVNLVKPSFTKDVRESIHETSQQLVVNPENLVTSGTFSPSAHYAGTSAIFTIGCGKASIYGLLGRGTQEVLVSDTVDDKPIMNFRLKRGEDEEEAA